MTQHVDEVARAIAKEWKQWGDGSPFPFSPLFLNALSRAAMRVVVKQMREPSAAMMKIGAEAAEELWEACNDRPDNWIEIEAKYVFKAMVVAYVKEAGIDE